MKVKTMITAVFVSLASAMAFCGNPGTSRLGDLTDNDWVVTDGHTAATNSITDSYIESLGFRKGGSEGVATNAVKDIIDSSFDGGTQKVNRVTGSFDNVSNRVVEIEGKAGEWDAKQDAIPDYATTNAVKDIIDSSFVGGTNAVNLVLTNTVVAATNDIAKLKAQKLDDDFASLTNSVAFTNAVNTVVTNTAYTKAETDAKLSEKIGGGDVPSFEQDPTVPAWAKADNPPVTPSPTNPGYAKNADYARSAGTASKATKADEADYAAVADEANWASTAAEADFASEAQNAQSANTANQANTAAKATLALTANSAADADKAHSLHDETTDDNDISITPTFTVSDRYWIVKDTDHPDGFRLQPTDLSDYFTKYESSTNAQAAIAAAGCVRTNEWGEIDGGEVKTGDWRMSADRGFEYQNEINFAVGIDPNDGYLRFGEIRPHGGYVELFAHLDDIPDVSGFVPYTGATMDVDLGEYDLTAYEVFSLAGFAVPSSSGLISYAGDFIVRNSEELDFFYFPWAGQYGSDSTHDFALVSQIESATNGVHVAITNLAAKVYTKFAEKRGMADISFEHLSQKEDMLRVVFTVSSSLSMLSGDYTYSERESAWLGDSGSAVRIVRLPSGEFWLTDDTEEVQSDHFSDVPFSGDLIHPVLGAVKFTVRRKTNATLALTEQIATATNGIPKAIALKADKADTFTKYESSTNATAKANAAIASSPIIANKADKSDIPDVSGFVPYTEATNDVNLGLHKLSARTVESSSAMTAISGYIVKDSRRNTVGSFTGDGFFVGQSINSVILPYGRGYGDTDSDYQLALVSQVETATTNLAEKVDAKLAEKRDMANLSFWHIAPGEPVTNIVFVVESDFGVIDGEYVFWDDAWYGQNSSKIVEVAPGEFWLTDRTGAAQSTHFTDVPFSGTLSVSDTVSYPFTVRRKTSATIAVTEQLPDMSGYYTKEQSSTNATAKANAAIAAAGCVTTNLLHGKSYDASSDADMKRLLIDIGKALGATITNSIPSDPSIAIKMRIPEGGATIALGKISPKVNQTRDTAENNGTFSVDWGDGNIEDNLTETPQPHLYNSSGNVSINILGDVAKVEGYVDQSGTTNSIAVDFHNPSVNYVEYVDAEPESPMEFGDNAFSGSNAKSVYFSTNVVRIGNRCFYGCKYLKDVKFASPSRVMEIGDETFYNCTNIESIILPDSITSLGIRSFAYCTKLKSISLPEHIQSIGQDCFKSLDGIGKIDVYCSLNRPKNYQSAWCFKNIHSPCDVYIHSPCTNVGYNAFYDVDGIKNITIGKSVRSLDVNAFAFCEGLTNVAFESNGMLESIGEGAFCYSKSLKELNVPEGVKYFGGAFIETGLMASGLHLPDSIEYLGSLDALSNKSTVSHFNLPENIKIMNGTFNGWRGLTDITIPKLIEEIGDYSFNYCNSLTNIVFDDGCKNLSIIGQDSFRNTGIERFICPTNVKMVGSGAFRFVAESGFNNTLKEIDLPSGITMIGWGAFNGLENLQKITIRSSVPPSCDSETLGFGTIPESCQIFVPAASVNTYKTNKYWRSYASQIQAM